MKFCLSRAEFAVDLPTIKQSFALFPFYTGTTLLAGSLSVCFMVQGVTWSAKALSAASSLASLIPGVFLFLAGAYLLLNACRNLPRFQAGGKIIGWNAAMTSCSKAPHAQILNALCNLATCQNYSLHHLINNYRVRG